MAMRRIDRIMLLEESEMSLQNLGFSVPNTKQEQPMNHDYITIDDAEINEAIRKVKKSELSHL